MNTCIMVLCLSLGQPNVTEDEGPIYSGPQLFTSGLAKVFDPIADSILLRKQRGMDVAKQLQMVRELQDEFSILYLKKDEEIEAAIPDLVAKSKQFLRSLSDLQREDLKKSYPLEFSDKFEAVLSQREKEIEKISSLNGKGRQKLVGLFRNVNHVHVVSMLDELQLGQEYSQKIRSELKTSSQTFEGARWGMIVIFLLLIAFLIVMLFRAPGRAEKLFCLVLILGLVVAAAFFIAI
ncbi:MAG: hypothetical protein HOO67_00535 [Candidatus Peribacteraceae bacterium]|nr:hypothetical protein [Candidatus Peribacteraceae bacterium]